MQLDLEIPSTAFHRLNIFTTGSHKNHPDVVVSTYEQSKLDLGA